MLITCPSCSTAYDLPAERIGASGRKVRCASCRESWFIASPEDKSSPAPLPSLDGYEQSATIEIVARPAPPPSRIDAEETAPIDAPARKTQRGRTKPAKSKPRRWSAILARAAAVAAVCIGPPALLTGRESVVSVLPGTATLYRGIGLPVNLVGLSFEKVSSSLTRDDATPVLEVTGEIVNNGRAPRTVPWLDISLEGEGGEPLYSWSAKAAEGELRVGETAPFRVRLTAPPPGARKVEVTFRMDPARRSRGERPKGLVSASRN